jgi:hypothetical protein
MFRATRKEASKPCLYAVLFDAAIKQPYSFAITFKELH